MLSASSVGKFFAASVEMRSPPCPSNILNRSNLRSGFSLRSGIWLIWLISIITDASSDGGSLKPIIVDSVAKVALVAASACGGWRCNARGREEFPSFFVSGGPKRIG